MFELLITLIITLLIVGVLLWAVSALPFIDANIKQIIRVLIIVVVAIWLIGLLAGMVPTPHFAR